ncbi:zinc finger, CCHC-type containing protein, partial [Tanacetum coccineum]
ERQGKLHETSFTVAKVALQPGQQVPPEALAAHAAWVKGQKEVAVLMLYVFKQAEHELLADCERISHLQAGGSFVQNYNMHGMGKTVNELHAMLKLHEDTLPKKDDNPALHAIRAGRVQKNQKNKPHKASKGGQAWALETANCTVYLAELMKKKKLSQGASASEAETKGALSLYVGDGHRAAVEAIGTYHLELPSGLVIVLNNCHYAPSITRVSKDNLVYFMAVPRDGIFEIDMSCSNTNDSSMYAITNKRAKINLDSSLLWHYRLGHISKKRIEKLSIMMDFLISIDH